MLLHHTTNKSACPDIAANGLRDGEDGFVCVTPDLWSWRDNWVVRLEGITEIGRDEVVLTYDVPDDVAVHYLVEADRIGPGHPDFEEGMEPWDPDVDGPWLEYRMPAELVNRYFAGIAFWHGDCPFDSTAMKALWHRRFGMD